MVNKKTKRKKRQKAKTIRLRFKGREAKTDVILVAVVAALSLFGILIVYDASVIEAYRSFSDKFFFVKQQLIWTAIGLTLAAVMSVIPYHVYKKLGFWAFAASLLLLFFVLLPGIGSKTFGARRWIALGSLSLQPAEFTKLTLIMYLASFLEKKVASFNFW